jgi:ketosteroid isomerase-like protein
MAEENVLILRAAYEAVNRGDFDGFLSVIDPNVEFRSLVAEVEGTTYRGHEGVREWWDQVARSLGGLRFDVAEIDDLGDALVSRLRVTGTFAGVDVPQTMWQAIRIRDGKAFWWATFRSEAEAREALRCESFA